jgi:hypothetical protein
MIFKPLLVGCFLQLGAVLYAQAGDPNGLKLKQTTAYGEQVVQVSFDGDDSHFGTFKVTDSRGQVVLLTQEAELIPSPYYFSVAIEGLNKEEYVFSVETAKGLYSTRFTIH